ncbi:hypothetical protein RA277_28990, partial [Pseudomonas syringae pv. tagetis]
LGRGIAYSDLRMHFLSISMTPDMPEAKPILNATRNKRNYKTHANTQTKHNNPDNSKKTHTLQTENEHLYKKMLQQKKHQAEKEAQQ